MALIWKYFQNINLLHPNPVCKRKGQMELKTIMKNYISRCCFDVG